MKLHGGSRQCSPLEATFYDEQIESSYRDFSSRIKVIGSLSFLAICIAAIGLLGMVVFTTETRIKEISIRKVLGASESNLVFLLTKEEFSPATGYRCSDSAAFYSLLLCEVCVD